MITNPKPLHEALPLHAPEALRGHRHTHGHSHDHRHSHDHDHRHAHGHDHHDHAQETQASASAKPRRSLLALSGGTRLMLALPVIACLWALAFWAVSGG